MFVSCAELEKAQHAKHQRAVIDSFLEMRIKLQVCIPAGRRMHRARSIPVRASINCNNRNKCEISFLEVRETTAAGMHPTARANRSVARTRRTTKLPHSHPLSGCPARLSVRCRTQQCLPLPLPARGSAAAAVLPLPPLVLIRSPSLPPQPTDG